MEIKGFRETSFLDWDGKIVSVIYLPYCNFRCAFCHNEGLIISPQQYEEISPERIKKYLLEHQDFIDGICVTGGEPSLHKDQGLYDFLREIKNMGFLVKVDTNGADPKFLNELMDKKLVDYIAMDIKAPLNEKYAELAGEKVNLSDIQESIRILLPAKVSYEFRTTVAPALSIEDIGLIAKELRGAQKWVLQQFSPENCLDENYRKLKPYPKEKLEEMQKIAGQYINNVSLRGV